MLNYDALMGKACQAQDVLRAATAPEIGEEARKSLIRASALLFGELASDLQAELPATEPADPNSDDD